MEGAKRGSLASVVFSGISVVLICVLCHGAAYGDVSEEDQKQARKHFNRGVAAVEMAEKPEDYEDAVHEFKKATELNPFFIDAYYNLALVQEKAGRYQDALDTLWELYEDPEDEKEEKELRGWMDRLEYKIEKQESRAKAAPEVEPEPEKPWTEKLNGRWVGGSNSLVDSYGRTWYSPNNVYLFQVTGNAIVIKILEFGITNANNQEKRTSDNYLLFSGTISGNNTSGTYYSWSHAGGNAPLKVVSSFHTTRTISLSADGNSLNWSDMKLRRE